MSDPSPTSSVPEANEAAEVVRNARISLDGLYRYALWRDWGQDGPRKWVTFVMLNPSTADGTQDDPTIRRCMGFARALGGTGLAVVNLYAYRATKPADLWRAEDPVGPGNDGELATFFEMAERHDFPIIGAWGANARPDRVAQVLAMPGAHRLQALGVTKAGQPRHPLYLLADSQPFAWPIKEETDV